MQTIADAVAHALNPTEHLDRPLPWAEWRAAVTHADAVLRAVDAGEVQPALGSALIGNAARAIVTGTPVALSDFARSLIADGRLDADDALALVEHFEPVNAATPAAT